MSKHFRPWRIDQTQLLPASVEEYVPEGHLSRFIVSLVRESLDLSAIEASYTGSFGQPPFDLRMMTALLLKGYASGIYSSRRIARACEERADFMIKIVEPVFGQIKQARGFRKFLLRGVEAVSAE